MGIWEESKNRLQELAGMSSPEGIKKLYVFDFDGTLMDTPLPEEGKIQWEEYYKESYPYVGWWSRTESLDSNAYDINPIPEVLNAYNKVKNEQDALVIMLTSRVKKVKPNIIEILRDHNLSFDKYMFKHGNKEKPERIDEILEEYPNIEYIEIWDDRDKEINLFNLWKSNKKNLNIIINQVIQNGE